MRSHFSTTLKILDLVSRIEQVLDLLEGFDHSQFYPKLSESHRVQTLQGNLSIAGNSLNTAQISEILKGNSPSVPQSDIRAVLNANNVYEQLLTFQGNKIEDLLYSHALMMRNSSSAVGKWRESGTKTTPDAERIPFLITNLFTFLSSSEHPLIKGCVFHYEFNFIRPFSQGNGRVSRVWHSLLLYEFHPIFEYIALEPQIRLHQQEHYDILEACKRSGDSTQFIEFSLRIIEKSLLEFVSLSAITPKQLRIVI